MSDKFDIPELFNKILDGDEKEATEAASKIIATGNDQALKFKAIQLSTDVINAASSTNPDSGVDAIMDFVKEQMASIYALAFKNGSVHTYKVLVQKSKEEAGGGETGEA